MNKKWIKKHAIEAIILFLNRIKKDLSLRISIYKTGLHSIKLVKLMILEKDLFFS